MRLAIRRGKPPCTHRWLRRARAFGMASVLVLTLCAQVRALHAGPRPVESEPAEHVRSQPQALLAGGAVSVCSSSTPRACVNGRMLSPEVPARYRLDHAGIERFRNGWWRPRRETVRSSLVRALTRWHRRHGDTEVTADGLDAVMHRAEIRAFWEPLASFERMDLFDSLESEPASEHVSLADSNEASGAVIYREFLAMARAVSGRKRPRIVFSTASSRDPYGAIDYYQELFTQAGAEVRWLALDLAVRAAQTDREQGCRALDSLRAERWGAQHRERLYPEAAGQLHQACLDLARVRDDLAWADGVFLNGGDQSFTRAAWFDVSGTPSAELILLRQRMQRGALVLGGTSAGAAVQAAADSVMLVSGSAPPSASAKALQAMPPSPSCGTADACEGIDPDALWFHPRGGLGGFDLGVVDTHFSERGRELRLARVLLDSGATWAVGVDENTALRWDRKGGEWQARVIGHGAVTWMQRHDRKRVQVRVQRADSAWTLPWTDATPVCAPDAADAGRVVSLRSTTDLAFRRALEHAEKHAPVELKLLLPGQTGKAQSLGHVCVATQPGALFWELAQ